MWKGQYVDGNYLGFIYVVPSEIDVFTRGRTTGESQSAAWWAPEDLLMPGLRPECLNTDWDLVKAASFDLTPLVVSTRTAGEATYYRVRVGDDGQWYYQGSNWIEAVTVANDLVARTGIAHLFAYSGPDGTRIGERYYRDGTYRQHGDL